MAVHKYVALETVFVNDCIVEKGQTFESDQDLGPAAVLADKYVPEEVEKPEDDTPTTFYEQQIRRGRPPGSKNKPKE
jgi:hypothetical protein